MKSSNSSDRQFIRPRTAGADYDALPLPQSLPADPFAPGDIVGGSYSVCATLGHGAMGIVYRVKHVGLLAEYALKILTESELNQPGVLRFQNEAQAIAQLNHPNIVAIYNFGLHDGRIPFYVMDLLQGENLAELISKQGALPASVYLPFFIEACAGLGYAHSKGILHRDVKPANLVLLDTADARGARIKVVDFGVVKFATDLSAEAQRLTETGMICGSPSYMSPEQACGLKLDARSDVYSLGCSLFETLTGRVPYIGRNPTETMLMHYEAPVPTLTGKTRGLSFPEDLELLVGKMLAKAPMDRYANMDAVALDLNNFLQGKPLGTPAPAPIIVHSSTQKSNRATANALNAAAAASDLSTDKSDTLEKERTVSKAIGKSQPFKSRPPIMSKMNIVLALLAVVAVGISLSFRNTGALNKSSTTLSATKTSTAAAVGGNNRNSSPSLAGETQFQLTKAKYFSSTVTENNKVKKQFNFPKPVEDEFLAFIGTDRTNYVRAEGTVSFDKTVPLFLAPQSVALTVPEFFDKFRPADINLVILTPASASDRMFSAIARIPNFSQLSIKNCTQLSNAIVPTLSKLNLTDFDAAGVSIDGTQMAKAKFWRNLKSLDLSKCKNLTPVLMQLNESKDLETLAISNSGLKQKDFSLISRIPNLKVLDVSHNKLSAPDLRSLSHIAKLNTLNIAYIGLRGESAVCELVHFPSLNTLIVQNGYLTVNDIQALSKTFPKLRILTLTLAQSLRMPDRSE